MTWLVRMEVNVETAASEGVYDAYGWHRKLWNCFPNSPEESRKFLTRVDVTDRSIVLWVLSRAAPERPTWCPEARFASKAVAETFLAHETYAFDLRACPTRAIAVRGQDGEPLRTPNGKRARGRRQHVTDSEGLRNWLVRKGTDGGFRIAESRPLEISRPVEQYFRKPGHAGVHLAVQFRGILQVTDRGKFVDVYHTGVGSAKGFGFGLLLLAPVQIQ